MLDYRVAFGGTRGRGLSGREQRWAEMGREEKRLVGWPEVRSLRGDGELELEVLKEVLCSGEADIRVIGRLRRLVRLA